MINYIYFQKINYKIKFTGKKTNNIKYYIN